MARPKGERMTTFSVRVPEALNNRLLHYCGKRDVDKTRVVRDALDKFLPIVIERDGDKPT